MVKKIILGIIAVIAVLILLLVIRSVILEINMDKVNSLEIENIDLSTIEDGTYQGSYSVFPISAKVSVTVTNHQITDIIIEGYGSEIKDSVIEAQSLQVDTITGATYSSKIILKAIEDALKKA